MMHASFGVAEAQKPLSTCLGLAGQNGPMTIRLRPLDRDVPIMGPGLLSAQ